MSAWAKPGAECVCIANDWRNAFGDQNLTMWKGTELVVSARSVVASEVFLQFVTHPSAWFWIRGFRPLTRRTASDDAAMFRELLLSKREREDA